MKKLISLSACILLMLAAVSPAFGTEMSSGYRNGSYYASLSSVRFTGDLREDICSVALSQVGYHEGGSESDISGESLADGNYTEYGVEFGQPKDEWCSVFIWWCAVRSGVKESIIRKTEWAKAITSGYEYLPYEQAQPEKGCILFIDENGDGTEDHTALCVNANSAQVITVEGNITDQVVSRTFAREGGVLVGGTAKIVFVADPDYEGINTDNVVHCTPFIHADDDLTIYIAPGGKDAGSQLLSGSERMLLAVKEEKGKNWFQFADGTESFWVHGDSLHIIYLDRAPITSIYVGFKENPSPEYVVEPQTSMLPEGIQTVIPEKTEQTEPVQQPEQQPEPEELPEDEADGEEEEGGSMIPYAAGAALGFVIILLSFMGMRVPRTTESRWEKR